MTLVRADFIYKLYADGARGAFSAAGALALLAFSLVGFRAVCIVGAILGFELCAADPGKGEQGGQVLCGLKRK